VRRCHRDVCFAFTFMHIIIDRIYRVCFCANDVSAKRIDWHEKQDEADLSDVIKKNEKLIYFEKPEIRISKLKQPLFSNS